MTEQEIRILEIFGRFNLRDALIQISKVSQFIFHYRGSDLEISNRFSFLNKEKKQMISQESLAYITRLLLLSKANDYKSFYPSSYPDWFQQILSNITAYYYEKTDYVDESEPASEKRLIKMFLSFYQKQFLLQTIDDISLLARSLLLYKEGFEDTDIKSNLSIDPSVAFKEAHGGFSLEEFLKIAFLITRLQEISARNENFYQGYLTEFDIEAKLKKINPELFDENKFNKVLELLSCNYQGFRDLDDEFLNPLWRYPLIKPKNENLKNKKKLYLLPTYPYFYLRVFDNGILDSLEDYYTRKGDSKSKLRSYFGKIYERYVGRVLKEVYPRLENFDIAKQQCNDGEKKIDYRLELENKIYLLEVKSSYINSYSALVDLQNDSERIGHYIETIVSGVEQLHTAFQEELAKSTCKEIIPILILNNSSTLLLSPNTMSSDLLMRAVQATKLPKKFCFKYLDFMQVEKYFDLLKTRELNLEDLCQANTEASISFNDKQDDKDLTLKAGNSFFTELVTKFYLSLLNR
jgi:hypothetical protein